MSKIYPKGVKHQLERLNAITTGPAALRIPSTVSSLKLRFNARVGESAYGAKSFWRQYLPPIQFYNPQLPISVERTTDNSKPGLDVVFADGKLKSIDAYGQPADTLLELLITETKAEKIAEDQQTRLGAETDL